MAYVKVNRNYRWTDKNPIIDVARTAVQDEGLMKRLKDAAELAGLSWATLDGWFNGEVRDPRHSSIMKLMIGLGYQNKWQKERKLNLEKELEFAIAWNKREREKAEKARAAAPRKKRERKRA